MNHLQFGNRGEQEAVRFLMTQGYRILHTNWRYKHLEADIIAKDGNILVFIEVKSRTSVAYGEPFTFVDHQKQKNLFKLAGVYLTKNQHQGDIRFDIVSIYMHHQETDIQLIKDAFWNY